MRIGKAARLMHEIASRETIDRAMELEEEDANHH